jgi:hypothetical protein
MEEGRGVGRRRRREEIMRRRREAEGGGGGRMEGEENFASDTYV